MTCYRIRRWDEVFLTAKTRNRRGRLRAVLVPCKLDDVDYIALMARDDGGACALGVWLALIELAGSLDARDGRLARSDGTPFTAAELSQLTRIPEDTLALGIGALAAVGWLVAEPCGTVQNDEPRVSIKRSEAKRSEAKRSEGGNARERALRPDWPGRSHEWDRCLELGRDLKLDGKAMARLKESSLDDAELYRLLSDVSGNGRVRNPNAYVVQEVKRLENGG